MKILVDTNVLLRSVQKSHPASEFWNVCTRPANVNGLGLSIEDTARYTDQLEKFFTILPDSNQAFRTWRRLVVDHAVIGVKVHAARLVAVMKAYGIERIVTLNVSDFVRFPGIEVVHPDSVK
jgi:predicted nucleic acid-binding protein